MLLTRIRAAADVAEVVDAIRSLGLQATRGARLVAMSRAYLLCTPPPTAPEPARAALRSKYYPVDAPERPSEFAPELPVPASPGKQQQQRARRSVTPISGLPGSGQYATDSYRIFCAGEDEWRRVVPKDKELVRFLVSTRRLAARVSSPPSPSPQARVNDER